MKTYRMTLLPKTAFGSPLLGESLFGMLCWNVAYSLGATHLEELLAGYLRGRPFAVISDAFPSGYLPLPALPNCYWEETDDSKRKYMKKKAWISVKELLEGRTSYCKWRNISKTDGEIGEEFCPAFNSDEKIQSFKVSDMVAHNTIHRLNGTTGKEEFSPYQCMKIWYQQQVKLDVYAVIDESRFTKAELLETMGSIGSFGFGRDASVGLGKFELTSDVEEIDISQNFASCLTLASSVLSEVVGVDNKKTFYRQKTHFGRHGAQFAVSGKPFKKPILLAQSGAVVSFVEPQSISFLGKGLSGVSVAYPKTVHQGYCPVLPLPQIFGEGR